MATNKTDPHELDLESFLSFPFIFNTQREIEIIFAMIRSLSLLLLANAFGQIAAYDYDCPGAGEHISVQPGSVSIGNSANGLCTLTTVTALGDLVAVARSYDGLDWEASPGPFAETLSISGCDGKGCTVDVSGISTEMKLTSYAAYLDANNVKDQKSIVAKFLEQAT